MPLTESGKKTLKNFKSQYGNKKGKKYFYMTINAGKLKGMHKEKKK